MKEQKYHLEFALEQPLCTNDVVFINKCIFALWLHWSILIVCIQHFRQSAVALCFISVVTLPFYRFILHDFYYIFIVLLYFITLFCFILHECRRYLIFVLCTLYTVQCTSWDCAVLCKLVYIVMHMYCTLCTLYSI